MIVSLIVAMDSKRGIGRKNALPWKLSSDLKEFKTRTMGHHVIAGRKTFDSIGRALPGRRMVIVSRNALLRVDDCDVVDSLESALSLAKSRNETECFVIGGAEMYHQSVNVADTIYLTSVEASVDADTFFPEIEMSQWQEVSRRHVDKDDRNEFAFNIIELRRKRE